MRAVVRGARQLEPVPRCPRPLEVRVHTAAVLSCPHTLSLSEQALLESRCGWPGRRPLCRRHPILTQGWANPGSGWRCWAQGWARGSSLPAPLSSWGFLGHPERGGCPGSTAPGIQPRFPICKVGTVDSAVASVFPGFSHPQGPGVPCASRLPTPAGPESLGVGVAVCLLPRAADSPERCSHGLGNLLGSPGPSFQDLVICLYKRTRFPASWVVMRQLQTMSARPPRLWR